MTRLPAKPRTHYFPGEGREYMQTCLEVSFKHCVEASIDKVVVFTATGEGPLWAVQNLLPRPEYTGIRVIAVTPPFGRVYVADPRAQEKELVRAGIQSTTKKLLQGFGVPVLAAQLPFKERNTGQGEERASEWTRAAQTLAILGGGFPLCVQAILIACDAGEIEPGERVVAASADTSLVALSSRTETFLSGKEGLLAEHVICRPGRYNISKAEHAWLDRMWRTEVEVAPPSLPENDSPAALPASSGAEDNEDDE